CPHCVGRRNECGSIGRVLMFSHQSPGPRRELIRGSFFVACVSVALLCYGAPLIGQQVPAGALRIIVPFPAGGGADFTPRPLAQKRTEGLGPTVVVENQTGANGNVGAAFVPRAAPDGTTLLLSSPGVFTTTRYLYKPMPFNPDEGLTSVSLVIISPNVLVRNADFPAATLQALIDRARANPGQLQYASQGTGSTAH